MLFSFGMDVGNVTFIVGFALPGCVDVVFVIGENFACFGGDDVFPGFGGDCVRYLFVRGADSSSSGPRRASIRSLFVVYCPSGLTLLETTIKQLRSGELNNRTCCLFLI